MRQIIAWIKASFLTTISAVAVIVAVGLIIWFSLQGQALRERMNDRQTRLTQISRLMNKTIVIPAEHPDQPPQSLNGITINDDTIQTLSGLFNRMNEEYADTRDAFLAVNQKDHLPLVPGLFPKPESPALPYNARDRYQVLIPRMLEAPTSDMDESALPRLDAGQPQSEQALKDAIAQFEDNFIESMLPPGVSTDNPRPEDLEPEDRRKLVVEKRARLKEMLLDRARSLHIYAVTDPNAQGFPLDFTSLRDAGDPKPYQLWEAQLELWVQQDIIRALALCNKVGQPEANITNVPVKTLLDLEVLPGYVGLHTRGGLLGSDSPNMPYSQPEDYSAPPENEVPRNFLVGPTGRMSNPLYDVRHARLDVIVDYKRLPELYNAIARVNLMTVLDCEIEDVDEFSHYRDGYVYGEDADAVRATLVIESLWLRAWTQEMMPKRVKQYLGILEPAQTEDEMRRF